jgi:hypothetical protein
MTHFLGLDVSQCPASARMRQSYRVERTEAFWLISTPLRSGRSRTLPGLPGNNPYCHYRALELQKQGLQERVVKIREAAPASFAVGEFELITGHIADGAVASTSTSLRQLVQLGDQSDRWESPSEGRVPPSLEICRACNSYIWPGQVPSLQRRH